MNQRLEHRRSDPAGAGRDSRSLFLWRAAGRTGATDRHAGTAVWLYGAGAGGVNDAATLESR